MNSEHRFEFKPYLFEHAISNFKSFKIFIEYVIIEFYLYYFLFLCFLREIFTG